jgi:hypothetical protein
LRLAGGDRLGEVAAGAVLARHAGHDGDEGDRRDEDHA